MRFSPVAFAAWAAAMASPAVAASLTPNVLFIAVDDLRPEHGVFGGRAQTPNIDAFAKSAMTFPRNYVQLGVCSPSRASLLTGRYPDTTSIYDLWQYFRETGCNVTTVPQAFKEAGYPVVAGAGKIFHPGHASGLGVYPDNGTSVGCTGCEGYNDPPSWTHYLIPPANNQWPWNVTYGPSWMALPGPEDAHPDAQTAVWAVGQIKAAAASGQPFFVAPGFLKPHLPFIFPAPYLDLYANYSELEADPSPPSPAMANLSWTGWSEVSSYADIVQLIAADGLADVIKHPSDAMPRAKAVELRRAYFAATSFNDAQVGKVLAALDEAGLAASTVVVLFGDHGWQLGTHGDWGKHTNFESVVRAPLLIRAPAYPQSAGAVAQAFTQHIDIFPTLLELTGVTPPHDASGLQGESLVPLLQDPSLTALPKRGPYAYSQYPRLQVQCPPPAKECAWPHGMGYTVRTEQWRYTEWVGFDNSTNTPDWDPVTSRVHQVELYAHSGDSGANWQQFENANVAADPQYAGLIANLSALLHAGPNLLHPSQRHY